jgi:hypothetical protein
MLTPVRLPPGRERLATRPVATGSPPLVKTIGIVEVAFFAAKAEGGPPPPTITSTLNSGLDIQPPAIGDRGDCRGEGIGR